jgi:uncharacterized coiled-coil protein SlyX
VAARAREIRRLNEQVDSQTEGIEFLRAEVASRDVRIEALDARVSALADQVSEGHRYVETVLAERNASVEALNAELHRVRVESDERRGHLEYATSELMKWERSIFGSARHAVQRAKRIPRGARRRLGKMTAPGTVPYKVGSRVLPRGLARWLRRRFAPVDQPARFVESADAGPRADPALPRDTGGLPALPSGKPDVVVLSIIDWDFRFQRPQQLAAQFGRHGHRVF